MNDHEKRIKEQRTIEANTKHLMGCEGKIGCIVKHIGQPLISQSSGGAYYSSRPSEDVWAIPGENDPYELPSGSPEDICRQIPVMDMEGVEQPEGGVWMERQETVAEGTEILGWHFDGLSRGMHIEIKYTEMTNELLVRYKGYVVYREMSGDLETYVPMPEWEEMIERLSKTAKRQAIKHNKIEKEENKHELRRQKESWMQRMKNKWGL